MESSNVPDSGFDWFHPELVYEHKGSDVVSYEVCMVVNFTSSNLSSCTPRLVYLRSLQDFMVCSYHGSYRDIEHSTVRSMVYSIMDKLIDRFVDFLISDVVDSRFIAVYHVLQRVTSYSHVDH